MTAWGELLDRFEATLAEQRDALAGGRPQDIEAFVPRAAGPLPADLVDRARSLRAQADALTHELTAAAANAGRQLQVVTVMKSSAQPSSSYIDQRG